MKNKFNFLLFAPILISLFLIFSRWFVFKEIIGGDWPYSFKESFQSDSLLVPSWQTWRGNGLGGTNGSYFLQIYQNFTFFLSGYLNIAWPIIYKIFWFGGFIFLSAFSVFYTIRILFPSFKNWLRILSFFIFIANSYILMILDGGQMGIALAYSVAPLVLALFIRSINNIILKIDYFQFQISLPALLRKALLAGNFKFPIVAGLVLAVQIMFDPRIAFISIIAILIYFSFFLFLNISSQKNKFYFFLLKSVYVLIPFFISFLLHSSWLLPFLLFKENTITELGSLVANAGSLKFFSFAGFSQSISLLHPNWPENIFGKVGFMKSEFILLPIFAFSSLLFLKSKLQFKSQNLRQPDNLTMEQFNNKIIIFFVALGLVGTFLAKGTNLPFGELNIWIFEHIPGFNMFRDPTKFYLLISLAYSVLVPFSVKEIGDMLGSRKQFPMKSKIFNLKNVFFLFTFAYLIFLIRPAILGQLNGTFKERKIPNEYIELKDFLSGQPDFFRTLWIPKQQRFGFASTIHPALEISSLFKTANPVQIYKQLNKKNTQIFLSQLSVRYLIIPEDSLGEIFLEDRKYNPKERVDLERYLDKIGWLKKRKIGGISLYENISYKNHFWFSENEKNISSAMITPAKYLVDINVKIPNSVLVFSENYSKYWIAKDRNEIITSLRTDAGLNSFKLNRTGNYQLEVYFLQQDIYTFGNILSFSAFITVVLILLLLKFKKI